MVRHFRELRVYQQAFKAAMRIYVLSKGWSPEERYSFSGGLVKMMAHPEQWCGPSNLIREDKAQYLATPSSPPYPHTPIFPHTE